MAEMWREKLNQLQGIAQEVKNIYDELEKKIKNMIIQHDTLENQIKTAQSLLSKINMDKDKTVSELKINLKIENEKFEHRKKEIEVLADEVKKKNLEADKALENAKRNENVSRETLAEANRMKEEVQSKLEKLNIAMSSIK